MTVRFPFRTIAACVALVLLAGACGGRGGQSRTDQVQISQRGPGMNRVDLGSLQLPVPRTFDFSHVEPEYFAAALGNDPNRIFEFVRDSIAFEAYTGVLRGSRGTLLAMAGNSADRALLLAALLQKSGHQIRFARGTLENSDAQELVSSMWATPARPQSSVSGGDVPPDAREVADRIEAIAKRDYGLIREQLKKAKIATRETTSFDTLVNETLSHYWVQWAKDGGWVDLDPSYIDSAPGRAYAKVEETFEALPDQLFHRVTITAHVEEYPFTVSGSVDGKPSTREVLRYSAKAADLAGIHILLAHEPDHWQALAESPASALTSVLQDAGQIKPVLIIGEEPEIGSLFMHRLKTTGLGGLGNLLSGAGTRDAVPVTTAEWLEFEFTAPDGTRETVVREMFDLVGKARRVAGQILTTEEIRSRIEDPKAFDVMNIVYDFFVSSGGINADHLAAAEPPPDLPAGEPPDIAQSLRWINGMFAVASDSLIDRLVLRERGPIRFYPVTPRLFITEFSPGPPVRISLDLRRDSVRAAGAQAPAEVLFAARVFHGVVDSTIERILMEYLTDAARQASPQAISVQTASGLFERAVERRIPVVLLPQEDSRLDGALPPDARARIAEQTARGLLAIVPRQAIDVDRTPRLAWWRIDAASGETVAVSDEGLHQGTTEITLHKSEKGPKYVNVRITERYGPGLRWSHSNTLEFRRGSRGFHQFLRIMLSYRHTVFLGMIL
jgi:hypothetical protein